MLQSALQGGRSVRGTAVHEVVSAARGLSSQDVLLVRPREHEVKVSVDSPKHLKK